MRRFAIAASFFAIGICWAQAEERLSRSYADCMEKASGVTPAMQECITAELERQDGRLNAAYKALMMSLTDKRKTELRDVQRKWIMFRDANCAFYFDPNGGTAARLAANECMVTVTAQRASELEALAQQ